MLVMNSEQIRKAEESAVLRGASFEEMMLKAGRNAAKEILKVFSGRENALIVCGKGKNGGDGFVVADVFAAEFQKVTVLLPLGEPADELSRKMLSKIQGRENIEIADLKKSDTESLEKAKAEIDKAQVIVDAVFGIGFSGAVKGDLAELINKINRSKAFVAAIDIPSGLLSDCGELTETYVKAEFNPCHVRLKAGSCA